LEVPCPKCGGDIAVRKTRRGDVFYGCTNYPKCDFSSNQKLMNEVCPKCDSAYLLELTNSKGTFFVCPNNRAALPKRRKKPGDKEDPAAAAPECSYIREISGPNPAGPGLRIPDPNKTRPLVESVA
jgi:DNA topoisomerase-1